jgi:hypothetical protein
VLAAVAVIALGYAAFGRLWLVTHSAGTAWTMGLRDVEVCDMPQFSALDTQKCVVRANDALPLRSGMTAAGTVTFVCVLVAAAALLAALGLELARRSARLPIAPTTISLLALVVALIAGCVFVARKPAPEFGPGLGFYAFGAGTIAGIAASVALAKLLASRDDDADDAPG